MDLFDGDEARIDEMNRRIAGGVRLFRLLPGMRTDLSPEDGQPHPRLSQRHRPERLSHG